MTDFQARFMAPILASAQFDPLRLLTILCDRAEGNEVLQDALIDAVEEMARAFLAEAAGLEAALNLRRLTRKGEGT